MAFLGTTFSIFQGLWRLVCHVIDMIQSKPLILLASAIPSPACGGASAVPSLPPSGPRGWRRAALAPIMWANQLVRLRIHRVFHGLGSAKYVYRQIIVVQRLDMT